MKDDGSLKLEYKALNDTMNMGILLIKLSGINKRTQGHDEQTDNYHHINQFIVIKQRINSYRRDEAVSSIT